MKDYEYVEYVPKQIMPAPGWRVVVAHREQTEVDIQDVPVIGWAIVDRVLCSDRSDSKSLIETDVDLMVMQECAMTVSAAMREDSTGVFFVLAPGDATPTEYLEQETNRRAARIHAVTKEASK